MSLKPEAGKTYTISLLLVAGGSNSGVSFREAKRLASSPNPVVADISIAGEPLGNGVMRVVNDKLSVVLTMPDRRSVFGVITSSLLGKMSIKIEAITQGSK